MLDPTLVLTLRQFPTLPPSHVEIGEERSWLSNEAIRAERRLRAIVEGQEVALREWATRAQHSRRLIESYPIDQKISESDARLLSDLITDIEDAAEHKAKRSARAEKKFAKIVKQLSSLDPSVAAVYRTYVQRITALDEEAIASMLDNALYLRAVRSEHEPDRGEGQIFTDPAKLEAHLKASL